MNAGWSVGLQLGGFGSRKMLMLDGGEAVEKGSEWGFGRKGRRGVALIRGGLSHRVI